jgi:N12 class adenine-specific DNA methylase
MGRYDDILGVKPQSPAVQSAPDAQRKPKASRYADILSGIAKPPPITRSMGTAIADTGRALASGVGSAVENIGTLAGLATGEMNNPITRTGQSTREYWDAGISPQLKLKRQQRQDAINSADGELAKFGVGIAETITDPALFVDTAASTAASMVPAFAAGRIGALASPLVGVAAGVGTGAAQAGADASAGTYERVSDAKPEVWQSNPEYLQRVDAGEDPAAVREALALGAARTAFPGAAGVSLASQVFPGARALERAVAGAGNALPGMGRVIGAAKGGFGEATQEAIEEGGGRLFGNLAEQTVNPNAAAFEGVGEQAGLGAVGGFALGAPAGALARPPEVQPKAPPTPANISTAPEPRPEELASQAITPVPAPITRPSGPVGAAAETAVATGAAPGVTTAPAAPPLIADTAAQVPAASPERDLVADAMAVLATTKGKVPGKGKLAQKLNIDGQTEQQLFAELERLGYVSGWEKGKGRKLLVDPATGTVVDPKEIAKLDKKAQAAEQQKALEAAVRGGPEASAVAAAAEAQGTAQAPAGPTPITRLSTPPDPAAFQAKMEAKRESALTRAPRPDPAAGPTSAAAAAAFDTGAAAIAEQQRVQTEQDQQLQAQAAQQAEAERAQVQQQKVAEKQAKEADKAARQADKDRRQAEKDAQAEALKTTDADIQAVVQANIDAGKPIDGASMMAMAKKLGVTPLRVDQMRQALAQKRKATAAKASASQDLAAATTAQAVPTASAAAVQSTSVDQPETAAAQAGSTPLQAGSSQTSASVAVGTQGAAETQSYDTSTDQLEGDITPPSGSPWTIRTAADAAAKRTPGGKVIEVDGGFVVRVPKVGAVKESLTAAPDVSAKAPEANTSEATGKEGLQVAQVATPAAVKAKGDDRPVLGNISVDTLTKAEEAVWEAVRTTPERTTITIAEVKRRAAAQANGATAATAAAQEPTNAKQEAPRTEQAAEAGPAAEAAKPEALLSKRNIILRSDAIAIVRDTLKVTKKRAQEIVGEIKSEAKNLDGVTYNLKPRTVQAADVRAAIEREQAKQSSSRQIEVVEAAPAPAQPEKGIVGRRADGVMIREDERGVRWYAQGGVRIFETVSMRPTRQGMQIDRGVLQREFMTAEESAAATKDTAPTEQPKAKPAPSANTIVTDADAEAARARLKAKFNRLNSGIDPEMMLDGITLGMYHIERGARTFAAYAKAMVDDLGDAVKPYLKSWYMGVKYDPRAAGFDGMDSAASVENAVVDSTPAPAQDDVTEDSTDAAPKPTEPSVRGGDQEGVSGAQERRERDAQSGNAPPDTGDVAAAQSEDVAKPGAQQSGSAAGVRSPTEDVAGEQESQGSGNAGTGRKGAGRKKSPDAGAGSTRGTDRPGVTKPETVSPANPGPGNFHIANPLEIVGGGQVARFNKNKAAIELFVALRDEGRRPTREEQEVLAGYTGWGSFGQDLFQGSWAYPQPKQGWEQRDQWLRDHLGRSDWEGLQRSITNAHYTDPPTVMAMWEMVRRMGFKGGRVLEPGMGIGNFFGMMPLDLKERSKLAGIELDPVTGGMAQMLYPDATVKVMGYQDSKTPDDFYDLVIGNWPFENTPVADRRYNRLNPMLHDYFFLKTLDQVRPGGIVIGITSAGSMDKKGTVVRRELAKKAELLASFRLPSGAFENYAGTKVVTDIIVLRKRPEPASNVDGEAWVDTVEMDTPAGEKVRVNAYYQNNPQSVVGTIDYGHGTTTFRPGMIVHRPDDMQAQLDRIVSMVPEGAYLSATRQDAVSYIANHTSDREGALTRTDAGLFIVRGEHLAPAHEVLKYQVKSQKDTAAREAQLNALIDMRKSYGQLIEAERGTSGAAPDPIRTQLRERYEAFVKAYGPMSESFGLGYLERIDDPFYYALAALETKDGNTYRPAAILSQSTIRSAKRITNPSIRDAFVLARNGNVNPSLDEIAKIAQKPEAMVRAELVDSGAVFETPGGDIVPSDMYLSGNVREKLRQAKVALADGNDAMQRNVEALEKVQPADIPYFNIEVQMGATWVPTRAYEQFVAHMLNRGDTDGISANYTMGRWKVTVDPSLQRSTEAQTGFGTRYYRFGKLVNAAISNQTVVIKERDRDGREFVDQTATDETNAKIADMREKFGDWLWSDAERRIEIEREYNEVRNAYASPSFDGSFLNFDGMALSVGRGPFDLRQHQVNAIWRALVMRRSLNAHEVGTGKTFTMGGIAVESRRYGIAKKPVLLAHNANSKSVASEIQMMYPAAKVLYIDNLSPKAIDVRLRQIANDDWDLIVLPHSLIERLSFREETLMAMAREEIEALEAEARLAASDDGQNFTDAMLDDPDELKKLRSPTAKELVKARARIIETIKKQAQQSSREGAVPFEDLGIDMVLVDEAHEFKKPPIATRMKMKGLQTQSSLGSIQLSFLTRYVREQNNGGNVHLFTGTPITNTLTEIFHQMRYIMADEMAAVGVDQWDGWFGSFAKEIQDVELTAAGDYEAVNRLRGFINVPELRKMVGQYMDVVFSDDMPEMQPRRTASGKLLADQSLTERERAELLNGRTEGAKDRPYKKVVNETADPTPDQMRIFEGVQSLANEWRNMGGKARRDAMSAGLPVVPIVYEQLAARASFDARMENDEALAGKEGNVPDHPDSKVSRAIRNLLEIYRSDTRATQVVFTNTGLGTTANRALRDAAGGTIKDADGVTLRRQVKVFSPIRDMVERLVQQGVPRSEIEIVDGSTSKDRRKEIADAMNAGTVRIVIGSTQSLGVGVNMQRNLRAMHHLDAPWMPGDLEQRNGRGHRQGNQWNTVMEYRYITDRIDGRRWQVLAIKQKFITDFLKADGDTRVIEGDAASDEESDIISTFAEAAGDPRVLIRQKLVAQVEQLQKRERLHTQGVADAKSTARNARDGLARQRAEIDRIEKSGAQEMAAKAVADHAGDKFRITVDGVEISERKEANEAIGKFIGANMRTGADPMRIGSYGGLPLHVAWPRFYEAPVFVAVVAGEEVATGAASVASLESSLRAYTGTVDKLRARIQPALETIQRLDEVAGQKFQRADQLKRAEQQLLNLEKDIQLNPVPPPAWLRNGAAIDTKVRWNGTAFVVTGHRWNGAGWFVIAQDAKGGEVVIPYLDAKDAQGMPLYEQREFKAPIVHAKPGETPKDGTGPTPETVVQTNVSNAAPALPAPPAAGIESTPARSVVSSRPYFRNFGGDIVHEPNAKSIELSEMPDGQFYIAPGVGRDSGQFEIMEATTGLRVGLGKTRKAAIEAANKAIVENRGTIKTALEQRAFPKDKLDAEIAKLDGGNRASFSKSADAPKFTPATARAWQALAEIPGTFQRPRTYAKSFEDITKAILPDAEVVEVDDGATITVQPQKDDAGNVARDMGTTLVRVEYVRTSGGVGIAPTDIGHGTLFGYTKDGKEAFSMPVNGRADVVTEFGQEIADRLLAQSGTAGRSAGLNTHVRALTGVKVNPLGKPKAVTMTILDGELAMDASQLQEGVHRGSALYSIALAYAHNNGITFIPDPADVSEAAMQRRGEHMLSSALKTGTTKHMLPHEDQGLDWIEGDDQNNLLELIRASADNVVDNVPDLQAIDYDWDSGQFVGASGKPFTRADFQTLAESPAGRAARAGVSTLRRGVVSRSLERRAGTPAWRGVVTRLLQLGRAGLRGSELESILYARGAGDAGARGLSKAALQAQFKRAADAMQEQGIRVVVVANGAELASVAPEVVAQDDYDDTVQAAITGDRKTVYFVAARIRSPKHAAKLFAHEMVGHLSMEQMLGPKLFRELTDRIVSLKDRGKWPEVFAEVERRYERNADGTFRPLNDATFASEAIAVFAERNIQTSILQRAMNAVRAWLRKLFPQLELSHGELRQLLWEAGQKLEGRAYRSSAEKILGRPEPTTQREAMERYSFGKDGGSVGGMKRTLVDPAELVFRESEQNRLDAVREDFPGDEYFPAVTILQDDGTREILDGHNRASVAAERGHKLPIVDVSANEYQRLTAAGFDDMEIAYAALDRANEEESAEAIHSQFPGADVRKRGRMALDLMDEPPPSPDQQDTRQAPPSEGLGASGGQALFAKGKDAAPVNKRAIQLNRVMRDAGWEVEYVDLDLTGEKPTADIRVNRMDGRYLIARVDSVGRATIETFHRERSLGMTPNMKGPRPLSPQINDVFLGRQRFSGARAMLRGMTNYLADNATNAVAIEDMRRAWGAVMESPTKIAIEHDSVADVAPRQGALFAKGSEPTIVDRLQEAISPKDTTLLQRLKDKAADWRPAALGALQLRHLGELGEDLLPPVAEYADTVQHMQTLRNELQQVSIDIVEGAMKYQGANKAEALKMYRMLMDATLAGVDPAADHQPLLMLDATEQSNQPVTPANVKAFTKLMDNLAKMSPGSAQHFIARKKQAKKMLAQEKKRADSHAAMKPIWSKLSPEGKKLWVELRDAYASQSDKYQDALMESLKAAITDDRQKARMIAQLKLNFESNRVPFYVPLSRWGEYFVAATAPDGTREFHMQESTEEQRMVKKRLSAAGYTRISSGVKSKMTRQLEGASASFIAEVDKVLQESHAPDKIRNDVYQLYLTTLPEMSMRKNFIHRKGTPGFSEDVVRALASHVFHSSYQIARLKYTHKLDAQVLKAQALADSMAEVDSPDANKAGQLVGELRDRHEWVMNPQDSGAAQKLTTLGFLWYLAVSPAAALVNLLQTAMVSFPVLGARYGFDVAARELWRGFKQSARTLGNTDKIEGPGALTDDEQRAYAEFKRRGTFDKSQVHNLAGLSETDTHTYNPMLHKALSWASFLFHRAEVVNRESTSLATYRMARASGKSHDMAIELGDKAVNQTHFDYSASNRSRYMRGAVAKVLLQFKQYSMGMTWLLGRMAWKSLKDADPATRKENMRALTGTLGMTALFSGTMGLPMMGMVMGIMNALAAAFGDDDEPWDAETELRAFWREMLGEKGAEYVMRGPVQAATGMGIASRVGLGELWFRSPDREMEGQALAHYWLEQAAGPVAGGMFVSALRGMQLMEEGQVWRGVETMLPKAIKDAMKAVRYMDEGVNNMRGDPVVDDLGVIPTIAQLMGMAPAAVANAYDIRGDVKGYADYIKARRTRLMDAFAMAWRLGDTDAQEDVRVKMMAFSRKYPELAITSDSIRKSFQQRARFSAQAENGVVVDPRIKARLESQLGMAQ